MFCKLDGAMTEIVLCLLIAGK